MLGQAVLLLTWRVRLSVRSGGAAADVAGPYEG